MNDTRVVASLRHNASGHLIVNENPLDHLLLRNEVRAISALRMSKPRDRVTPEYLSHLWNCGLRTAQQTIEATTCRYYRHIDEKGMTRRFRISRDLFRYKQLSVPVGEFYTDALFANVRSARGFTCAQVYGNKFGFLKVNPMESNTQEYLGDTLNCLVQDTGVPQKLHSDNANEMIGRGTPFFKRCRKEGIHTMRAMQKTLFARSKRSPAFSCIAEMFLFVFGATL